MFWIKQGLLAIWDIESEFISLINQQQPQITCHPRGNHLEQVESEGIIISSCCKIETTLKEKKAYDKKSATDILEFGAVLMLWRGAA